MGELVHKLGINWKLLAAQALNFLILLFLLRRFLYRPILELLARRRKDIEDADANAKRIERELAGIEARRAEELEKAKKEADAIIGASRTAAKAQGEELAKAAEKRVEKLVEDAKRRIEEERVKMMDEAGKDVTRLVIAATEQVLKERLPQAAHERFVEEAIAEAKKAAPRH